MRAMAALAIAIVLAGCGESATQLEPLEQVVEGPVMLTIAVTGEVQAVEATPINVPGERFSQRRALWLLADGEPVKAGDLIARFSPDQSELDFAQAAVDLQRNLIANASKQAELAGVQNKVATDLADVAIRMTIAERYADADVGMLARNEILDAIDDEQYLDVKQTILEWQRDNASARGATEIAVLDAQRTTYERNAQRSRTTLDAMELRAPHAGVLVLTPNWIGEKPRVGGTLMAGEKLASIPNVEAFEIMIEMPQAESQGLAIGQPVRIHPLGRPDQKIETKVSWISGSAQPRNNENPARYLTARAPISADVAERLRLVPGQRMEGRVEVLAIDKGITVPNTAIVDVGGRHVVHVRAGGEFIPRDVKLGVRSSSRSQVLSGLAAGDLVRLIPPPDAAAAGRKK